MGKIIIWILGGVLLLGGSGTNTEAHYFVVNFPKLLGDPVEVVITGVSETHCNRVKKLLQDQLDDHKSNATASLCERVN